ncbi:MAG: hypothetical protein KKA41_17890 [Proteobacteria bacterium]|nr:hypothetical protein [Pseudomonadota bacterium]
MNARDQLMNEYISYGGAAYKRYEAYQDALEATGSKQAADRFAFKSEPIPETDLLYYLRVREAVEREEVIEAINASELPRSQAASERRDKIIIKIGQVSPDTKVPVIDYNQFEAGQPEVNVYEAGGENMDRYILTTEHSTSSYGIPVLVDTATGEAYGRGDILPDGTPASELYRKLEVD